MKWLAGRNKWHSTVLMFWSSKGDARSPSHVHAGQTLKRRSKRAEFQPSNGLASASQVHSLHTRYYFEASTGCKHAHKPFGYLQHYISSKATVLEGSLVKNSLGQTRMKWNRAFGPF